MSRSRKPSYRWSYDRGCWIRRNWGKDGFPLVLR